MTRPMFEAIILGMGNHNAPMAHWVSYAIPIFSLCLFVYVIWQIIKGIKNLMK
jgi:hypothetical protein